MKLIKGIVLFLFLVVSTTSVFAAADPTPIPAIPSPIPTVAVVGQIGDSQDQIDQATLEGTINHACINASNLNSTATGVPTTQDLSGIPLVGWVIGLVSPIGDIIGGLLGNQTNQARGQLLCSQGRPNNPNDPANCTCLKFDSFNIANMCTSIANPKEKTNCLVCSDHGIWTALGCVDFSLKTFIEQKVFGFGLGLGGLLTLFCMIIAAFRIQTSQGNPEKIKKAQEMLTSCVIGLLVVIFSVFILQIIGVDILRIPGFGK